MKRRSFAKQRDKNEPEIVDDLRQRGASVELQDEPLDLLVGVGRQTFLLEVKRGDLSPADRPLKPSQRTFLCDWRGGPAGVVRCCEEARCFVKLVPCRQAKANRETGYCECGQAADPSWFTEERARLAQERAENAKAARAAARRPLAPKPRRKRSESKS